MGGSSNEERDHGGIESSGWDGANSTPVASHRNERAPGGRQLDEAEAREVTNAIRRDAQELWIQLLRAYEGNAHGALGYTSWADYCAAEFDFSKSRSYQLLQAARVVELTEPQSTMVDSDYTASEGTAPGSERVAREFAPLLDRPDELRQAHEEAVAAAPRDTEGKPRVTAAVAREAVAKRRAKPTPPPAPRTPPAAGASVCPGGGNESGGTHERRVVGLNEAVSALRRAIQRDPEQVGDALSALRESAARGLYRPETKDAPGAFRDLVDLVAALIAERGGGAP